MIGNRIGPYEVTGKIGEGGMGEVYRATDARLRREVAIKVLPPAFTADADRLARFEREAQLLAQLHHPNIAAVHGLEESGDGARALVMELVEGEDLSQVIARGPLPLHEAIAIARQIADGLAAAHEQGIVHRDLKPANVKLRADGAVKVLDFGLAKASGPTVASGDAMNSPTLSVRATQLGLILGTAAYMAPEQAKGRAVDQRADVWAFGAVLYEMLTGQRAFPGDDVTEVMASVIKSDPDWAALPADTPAALLRLLRRCLEKDPRRRLSAIADARLELEEAEAPAAVPATDGASPTVARPARFSWLWPAVAAIALAGLVASLLWHRSAPTAAGVRRLSILVPPGGELYPDSANVAISPDGRSVAFVLGTTGGQASQLWVRSLDSLAARRLTEADNAQLPFWSPDSQRIAFIDGEKLKEVSLATGHAEVLCSAHDTRGGTWSPAGVIVFAPTAGSPLYRVSANGGEPVPVTRLDAAHGETGHRFPSFLPDGEHFLYVALPAHAGRFDVFVGSLRDDRRTRLGTFDSAPVYAEAPGSADRGWLLFRRGESLAAQRFDARRLTVEGEAVPLEDQPGVIVESAISFTAGRAVSVSRDGSLAYYSPASMRTRAAWLDEQGRIAGDVNLPAGRYTELAISPDGTHAAVVRSVSPSQSTIWLVDLQRGGATPLTEGPGLDEYPVWSPDGTRLVFGSDRGGVTDFYVKEVGDAAPARPFYRSAATFKGPHSWSPDGKWVAMAQLDAGTLQDLYVIPGGGGGEARLLVRGPGRDLFPEFSPDGKWLLYEAEDSGQLETYAQTFPGGGHRVHLSDGPTNEAWWTPDQRQVIYLDAASRALHVVDVEIAGDTLRAGQPRVLASLPPGIVALAPAPDRKRWLAFLPDVDGPGTLTVVENWMAALQR